MANNRKVYPIWDNEIVDFDNTTASFSVATPQKKECVFVADKEWEGGVVNDPNVIEDDGKYKMYYLAHYHPYKVESKNGHIKGTTIAIINTFICYAESDDGLTWTKPNLRICEYNGSVENNIILRSQDKPEEGGFFDNFFVFKDTNPNCEPERRYKALAYSNLYKLSSYVSADGLNFKLENIFDIPGKFDTLNVCYFDERINKYVAYVRDFHNVPEGDLNAGIRDVRRTESSDFINWSTPELITFIDSEDYPLYTNNISRYYRNTNLLIGFPTRYVERKEWTDNFERLTAKEVRLEKMKIHKRHGLTITDCIFMVSHDGKRWYKYDEALFTPEREHGGNWSYGCCYPAYFMLETPADDGINTDLSMFMPINYSPIDSEQTPEKLCRYVFRRDGFAYYSGKYTGQTFVTNEFLFDGDYLEINFSTSARGNMFVTITSEDGEVAKTCELFGDNDSRRIDFIDNDLAIFKGKKVKLHFEMRDAKLYSFAVCKN